MIIACLVCLAGGTWLGWRLRGEPPKPEIKIVYREREDSKAKSESKTAEASASSSLQVTPPSHTRKKRVAYHPPTVSCAPTDKPCVCPGPGPVAEVEETDTTVGKGIVASGTQSNATAENKVDLQAKRDQEALQQEGAELPRLALNFGVALNPLADELRPAPALGGTLRIFENYTAQAVIESQLDLKQMRIVILGGIPIW